MTTSNQFIFNPENNNKMTIDFTNDTGTIYQYGVLATESVYALRLLSKYSNKYMMFEEDNYLRLTNPVQYGTKYYSVDWNKSDVDLADVAGYYNLEIYGGDDVDSLTLLKGDILCKVIQDGALLPDTTYVSDNDDNELEIYFVENE